jgi:hypothetical protein
MMQINITVTRPSGIVFCDRVEADSTADAIIDAIDTHGITHITASAAHPIRTRAIAKDRYEGLRGAAYLAARKREAA